MITFLFDIIILAVVILLILKLEYGILAVIVGKIFIPYYVRFQLGSFSLAYIDVLNFAIFVSFFAHYKYIVRNVPVWLKRYAMISVVSTLVLVFLSSAIVPYGYQLKSLLKGDVVGLFMLLFLFCAAFQKVNAKVFVNTIMIASLVAGLYGILVSVIGLNPYVSAISINYTGKDYLFAVFLEDARAGLNGRSSGTMVHPLGWGQFWVIMLSSVFLFKDLINRNLGAIIVAVGLANVFVCGARSALLAAVLVMTIGLLSLGLKKIIKVVLLFFVIVFAGLEFCGVNMTTIENSDAFKYVEGTMFFWDENKTAKLAVTGSSVDMRKSQMEATFEFIATNPIAGVGYNYQMYALENANVANRALWGMESILYKKLVEQGFLGFAIFCLLMFMIYKNTIKWVSRTRRKRGAFGAFMGGYLVNIFATGMQGDNYFLFLTLVVFYYIYLRRISENDSQNNPLLLAK